LYAKGVAGEADGITKEQFVAQVTAAITALAPEETGTFNYLVFFIVLGVLVVGGGATFYFIKKKKA